MVKYEYINFKENLYYVYRKVNVNAIKEQYIQDVKTIWGCDIVLKYHFETGDMLFFLRQIPELEILN